jgi:NOL1/NOP2/sun family putative RNA methylase
MNNLQHFHQNFPEAFLVRMAGLLGNDFNEFRSSLNLPPTVGLRVNTLKISLEEFLSLAPYQLNPVIWCSIGFTINELNASTRHLTPGKHPYHSAGLYYLQEPSAMAAADALSPQPGEKVLDLAAAPGGKSTHLATLMKNEGLLVANEIHPRRVWDLAENLERCGVINAVVTNETPQRLADHWGDYFDKVMLDAPCSGEGMFRKSVVARKEWKTELVRSCAIRQTAILEQASRLVRPGGTLAYTTCTFSPDENEGVIFKFLEKHLEYDIKTLQSIPGYSPSKPDWIGLPQSHKLNRAMRLWPHLTNSEGHFIALLIKNDSMKDSRRIKMAGTDFFSKSANRSKQAHTNMSIKEDLFNKVLSISFDRDKLFIQGSYLYRSPDVSPNLTDLKVIHPGWWLGAIQKERFIPSHALAMGMDRANVQQVLPLELGDQRVSSYLAGECFSDFGENEWVLVTVDSFPIGWGKRVNNVVKNYYPHGLRHSG